MVRAGADFSDLEKKLQTFGKKMDKVSKSLKKYWGALTKAITIPLAAVGVASFKFAADLEDAFGATDQIF